MVTKKKQTADEPVAKAPVDSSPKPKAKANVEVDWGKGFVEHNDAVLNGSSLKVPVPPRVGQTLGQSQTRGRYDRIKVKVNGQEARIGERRFHKASDGQASLTFEIIE